MKILFIGVFDAIGKSTNTSQLMAFKSLGCEVVGYNYKQKALSIGASERDNHLCSLVKERKFDLVVFSKCDFLPVSVFERITKITKTYLWWMDPITTLYALPEMLEKAKIVHAVITGVKNTIDVFEKYNDKVYYVPEGFDSEADKPHDLEKEIDVVFIGSLHGERKRLLEELSYPVKHISNAYGPEHAKTISKSKICLNFSTAGGTSDRIYKTLAAGGFLLSSDWHTRHEDFEDGEDLVIFKDIADLREKIIFYLDNPAKRGIISQSGHKKVQKFNRMNWAEKIVQTYKGENS